MDKMQKIGIVWGIVVFLLIAALTTFGFVYKRKSTPYQELEENLLDATKKYVDANFLYPQDNNELKVTSDILIENSFLEELKKDDDECSGYTIVKLKNGGYTYKSYIKCPNYKTKGYTK